MERLLNEMRLVNEMFEQGEGPELVADVAVNLPAVASLYAWSHRIGNSKKKRKKHKFQIERAHRDIVLLLPVSRLTDEANEVQPSMHQLRRERRRLN